MKLERLIETEKNWLDDRPAMKKNNANPERMSNLLMGEVVELIEAVSCYSLSNSMEDLKKLGQEVADVFKYLLTLCLLFDIDLYAEVMEKTAFNHLRYPARAFTKDQNYNKSYREQKAMSKASNMKEKFYV